MATTIAQQKVMIKYMKDNGDLSMRASPRFKAVQEKKWEILTTILNSQRGGTKKTVEQWQKVWRDYKQKALKEKASIRKKHISFVPKESTTRLSVNKKAITRGLSLEDSNVVADVINPVSKSQRKKPVEKQQKELESIVQSPEMSMISTHSRGFDWSCDESLISQKDEKAMKERAYTEQSKLKLMELQVERERIQIRNRELDGQEQWQKLAEKALNIVNIFVQKNVK